MWSCFSVAIRSACVLLFGLGVTLAQPTMGNSDYAWA
jgi:hypothetical protein